MPAICAGKHCAKYGKRGENLSFFRFPRDIDRCKKWIINSGRVDLERKSAVELNRKFYLCSLHFDTDQFTNEAKNRLNWNAIPTNFPFSKCNPEVSVRQQLLRKCDEPRLKRKGSQVLRYILPKGTETSVSAETVWKQNSNIGLEELSNTSAETNRHQQLTCSSDGPHLNELIHTLNEHQLNQEDSSQGFHCIFPEGTEASALPDTIWKQNSKDLVEVPDLALIVECGQNDTPSKDVPQHQSPVTEDLSKVIYVLNRSSPLSSDSMGTGLEQETDDGVQKIRAPSYPKKMTVLDKHFSDAAYEALLKFQERGFLCDAVLVAKCGGEVKAHAVLLAAVSPIFLAALQISTTGPHRFCFPEVELDVLQIAVYFIYTGKLRLPTVYSQMDKLSLLLSSLSDLGIDLEKLHGSEMTFVRKGKVPVAPKLTESFVSDLEHNYHKTKAKEGGRKKATDSGDSLPSEPRTSAEKTNGTRPVQNIASVLNSGLTKGISASILKPLDSIVKDSSGSGDAINLQPGLLKTELDQSLGQILVLDSDKTNFWNVVGENGMVGDGQEIFNYANVGTEQSPAVALQNDNEPDMYVCDFCEGPSKKEFRDEFGLSWHKIKFHWDRCLRCSFCSRRFGSENALTVHLHRHLRGGRPRPRYKNYRCDECGILVDTVTRLRIHKLTHSGEKPHECADCGRRFTQQSNLERHQMLHTGYRPYLCDFCGKGFVQKCSLVEHTSLHHEDEQEVECALCNCTLKNKVAMEKHALEVHQLSDAAELNELIKKPELHLCDLCGKNFASATTLKNHIKAHGNKPTDCETCGKKFSTFYGLQLHMKLHTGERPFVCEICHKGFIQKTSLTNHMVLHSGVKPFFCTGCSKAFTSKGQLKQHMLMHTGEKPYKCATCNKQFTYKSSLALHNRTHTGDKPYKCTICGTSYTQMHHLRGHMRTHTGEKPFVCEICGKSYKNKVDLRYHYTRFHKVDVKKVTLNSRSQYIFRLDEKIDFPSSADDNSASNLEEEFTICEIKSELSK